MANIKASKKDIITNKRNHDRNVHLKSKMKTAVKKAILSIESNSDELEKQTRSALKTIDKLASKGVLHKRTASRKKSRLMKKANTAGQVAPVSKVSDAKKTKKTEKPVAAKKIAAKASVSKVAKTTKAPTSTKAKTVKKTTKKTEK